MADRIRVYLASIIIQQEYFHAGDMGKIDSIQVLYRLNVYTFCIGKRLWLIVADKLGIYTVYSL